MVPIGRSDDLDELVRPKLKAKEDRERYRSEADLNMNIRDFMESCESSYKKYGACYRIDGVPSPPPKAHRDLVDETLLPLLQEYCRVKTDDNDEATSIPAYYSGSDMLHGWLFDNKRSLSIRDEDISPLITTTSIRFGQEMLSEFNPTRRDVQEMAGDQNLKGACFLFGFPQPNFGVVDTHFTNRHPRTQ